MNPAPGYVIGLMIIHIGFAQLYLRLCQLVEIKYYESPHYFRSGLGDLVFKFHLWTVNRTGQLSRTPI